MEKQQNLANAILIIACIYFWSSGAIGLFSTLLLILFCIVTWEFYQTEDKKKLIKLGIKQAEANIQNLNAATAIAIAIANTKLIASQNGQ